jgi:hypothetical protein
MLPVAVAFVTEVHQRVGDGLPFIGVSAIAVGGNLLVAERTYQSHDQQSHET